MLGTTRYVRAGNGEQDHFVAAQCGVVAVPVIGGEGNASMDSSLTMIVVAMSNLVKQMVALLQKQAENRGVAASPVLIFVAWDTVQYVTSCNKPCRCRIALFRTRPNRACPWDTECRIRHGPRRNIASRGGGVQQSQPLNTAASLVTLFWCILRSKILVEQPSFVFSRVLGWKTLVAFAPTIARDTRMLQLLAKGQSPRRYRCAQDHGPPALCQLATRVETLHGHHPGLFAAIPSAEPKRIHILLWSEV
jgi:hypothetical protein